MKGTIRLAVCAALAAGLAAACNKVESQKASAADPATTQAGSAGDQSRGAKEGAAPASCRDLPSADDLKKWLRDAPAQGEAGGLMSGRMEWAAIVDRVGEICATAVATDDPASAWPGSQAIAKAKAYTANAYSTDLYRSSPQARAALLSGDMSSGRTVPVASVR